MNFRIPFFVLLLLLGYGAFAHSEDRGKQLFDEVVGKAKECAAGKSGSEVSNCYIRATPKKCQPHVINLLSREEKDEARRAWYLCIASCADAGFWSANFGECSRELK
jgi:hypothetical protein